MKSRKSSFKHIGGSHGGAIDDPCKPSIGQGKVGTDSYCGSAKSKQNISPPNANHHSDFGNCGGKVKHSNG